MGYPYGWIPRVLVGGMSAVRIGLWVVLWCLCCTVARAETPALTIYNSEEYPLADYVDFFEDPERKLTFDDIRSPAINDQFKKLQNKLFTYGITYSNLWFRAKLRYPEGAPNYALQKRWLFEVARTLLNEADLYIIRADGRVQHMSSDIRTPFSQRPLSHHYSVFPVDLSLGEEVTLYLKIWNYTSTYVPQTLWSEAGLAKKTAHEGFLYGIYYGGLIFICVYNLLLYFSSRDIGYFYYVGYLLAILLFTGIDVGPGVALFGEDRQFEKRLVLTFLWLAILMGSIFIHKFLDFKTHHPVLHYFMQAAIVLMCIAMVVSHYYDPTSSVRFAAGFTSTVGGMIFLASAYALYAGNPNAPYFLSAWFMNLVGLLIYSLIVRGVLPAHPVLLSALPVGIWLEAIILSQALANRIKQSEKAVFAANQRAIENLALYRSVFDNALEGLYQMSLSGRLLSANPAFARMLGYSSATRVLKEGNQAIKRLYAAPDLQLQQLALTGNLQEETDINSETGHQAHVSHHARLVYDERGEPLHIEGTLVDIGERKMRELAQRSRLRERREKELAKNVTDAKSAFLKNMSYEIRTPLSAIIGFAESLRYELLSHEEKKQTIASINRNSYHLLQLINDILDYSKIEAGKMSIEAIPVELMPLLQMKVDKFSAIAHDKGLAFSVEYQFPLPRMIVSDPTRLKQILQNLCSNAIKYTDKGAVKLVVQWDSVQRQLVFAVHDTGMGMSKERVRRILLSMHQSRGNQIQEGIGLGIAITQQLVRLFGGQLDISSVEGQGSQFTARLSCPPVDHTEWLTETQNAKPTGAALNDIPHLNGRVLLAEDNPVNQKLIQRVIAKTGAEVVVVADGQQALHAAMQHPFDLILMDVNMPVMGGLEATRALRASGYRNPIYALTAEHGQAEVDASLAAGCEGHLLKPLELVPFYQVLAKCLNRSAA